ncbi:MAG: YmdB family metallophosphoesterase, partial [Candidatus Cloacimonetes bacterium]|nr:YmdB family metallophosphoesterase [Candidatus Cloacimonadota bacterium]
EDAINRFIKQIPVRFNPAKGNLKLNGVIVSIDEQTGKAITIQRLSIPLEKREY